MNIFKFILAIHLILIFGIGTAILIIKGKI